MVSLLMNTLVNFTVEIAGEGTGATVLTWWAHNHFGHQVFTKDQ